jgi:rsbT co-antagonist protein RsbR
MTYKCPQLLLQRKQLILDLWIADQLKGKTTGGAPLNEEELRGESEELLEVVLEALAQYNQSGDDTGKLDPVTDVLRRISGSHGHHGLGAHETILFIFSLKDALVEVLKEEFKYEPSRLFEEASWICKIIDRFSVTSVESFVKGTEQTVAHQTEGMTEAPTPVMRIWKGVLALPLTGTLDTARIQRLIESLLQEIVRTESDFAILDISGIGAVDSQVAQHLLKTVSATRLMGAECIISGIRPETAQTIVQLGIDLSNITTKATMAHALRFALQQQGIHIREDGPPAET